jgi:aryl-alcohol dehydrogenase-like predicted oxidoreductase
MKRTLGRSGIEVSALGLGCWAIGGPWTMYGGPAGWGEVDDAESERAIRRGIELGVTFFDTAANYGCGHSERVLGKAIRGMRDRVVIASKFGYDVDEAAKNVVAYGSSQEESDPAPRVRGDLEKTLSRLGTDYIDVYLLHVGGLETPRALEVRDELERLVKEGKVRTYGWSTDRADAFRAFATSPYCAVVEQQLSVFDGNEELLAFCERENIASVNRGPLAMGLLTGKFSSETKFASNDFRSQVTWHPGYANGVPRREWVDALSSIREILTSGGRTLAQGALAWLWARSPNAIPIPGFRTQAQAEENALAMEKGPLNPSQMEEIARIIGGARM